MLEYDGDVEVVLNDGVAHFNAQGVLLTLTVSSPDMLSALIGVYRRLPEPGIMMKMPFAFEGHQLVVNIVNGGSVVITRRQSWVRNWLPYQLSFCGFAWWLRYGPGFLFQYWQGGKRR
ncbi:hypothetical protein [Photobacterium satsumensis]|uniref:hypothetical protein n=1 Tax=Photobacterium satsumensis TaxID=2910239 RepID=UPI003D0ACF76